MGVLLCFILVQKSNSHWTIHNKNISHSFRDWGMLQYGGYHPIIVLIAAWFRKQNNIQQEGN